MVSLSITFIVGWWSLIKDKQITLVRAYLDSALVQSVIGQVLNLL
jgi:hypothetical protein